MARPAAFLDRDGVINEDRGYVHRWEDFVFVAGAVDGLRRLQAAGYALVVVTNQSGIARGFYDEAALQRLHDALRAMTNQSGIARGFYDEAALQRLHDALRASLAAQGIELAAIEYCPHLPQAQIARYALECDCRKPGPGMILRAARTHDLDLARSLMFGDRPSDIEAGRRAGVGRCVLLAANGVAGEQRADFLNLPAALDALAVPDSR